MQKGLLFKKKKFPCLLMYALSIKKQGLQGLLLAVYAQKHFAKIIDENF
jgi:hypothetical protein